MPRPRRRFGQHFLHARGVIDRIVRAVAPQSGDAVVEIGPGPGALTGALLERGVRLAAIEIDRDLARALAEAHGSRPGFRVVTGDALEVTLPDLFPGEALRVVGNLPYNVSTPLLFHCLTFAAHLRDMHFMLQREVVDRIVAQPGSREYGRLSIAIQRRCRAKKVLDVGPGAFWPPPRVDSAVVRLEVRSSPLAAVRDPAQFEALVAHLSRRRKTLRAALKGKIGAEIIEAAGIDPGARAETLEIATLARLSDRCAPGLFTGPVDKSVRNLRRRGRRADRDGTPRDRPEE